MRFLSTASSISKEKGTVNAKNMPMLVEFLHVMYVLLYLQYRLMNVKMVHEYLLPVAYRYICVALKVILITVS